mgnify:FL=1
MKIIHGMCTALFSLPLLLAACSVFSDAKSGSGDYTITGTVLDKSGNAVSGVKISAGGVSDETGSDGSYKLKGLERTTVSLSAEKSGYTLVPQFSYAGELVSGSAVNVGAAAVNGTVSGIDFTAVEGGALTIADIQGSGAESPLKGSSVEGITGVVTLIMNKAPHWNYNNPDLSGDDAPQYVGSDGFFIEALPDERDYSGAKSNGIFINTHDDAYTDSKWLDSIPTDLQAGDVVTVSGTVEEVRQLDRYNSTDGSLTRTQIKADTVLRVYDGDTARTAAYPLGVLVTYSQSASDTYKAKTYTYNGETYNAESRVMPYDVDAVAPLQEAIDVLESMEGMVIRIENPLVVGATYYNLTSVLADGGKDESGNYFRTFNEDWMGNVIRENPTTGYQDYNEEVLFVDYQPADWSAYKSSIPQIGDTLIDANSDAVFRGVLDYTCDSIYMAHPLNNKSACYIQSSSANYVTPFYTRYDSESITDLAGETVPNQKWGFSNESQWYLKLDADAFTTVSQSAVETGMTDQKSYTSSSSSNGANIKKWRTGTSSSSAFDASSVFTPLWSASSSPATGNTDLTSLTVASFNIENYEAQGGSYAKDVDVALVIKNNLLYPDVLVVVEMGDDVETPQTYANQDNSWAAKDGVVTAVRNFSGIIDDITSQGGPQYEFRCVDPKEQDSGGKPGVNIRVGFMYNTERVAFVDRGLPSNYYANTHDENGDLLDEDDWPVQTANDAAQGWVLAETASVPYRGDDGSAHLTQSPGYIQNSYFSHSRRPLAGEFVVLDSDGNETDQNFFVIACHLGSKRGDYSLYGNVQPPLLLSESKRNGQAQAVHDFVQKLLSADSGARIVVAGDMNDFAYGTPMKVLTGVRGGSQILYSLVEELMPDTEQFSYTYQGNMQELDHIYVSASLWQKVSGSSWKDVCFIPHINSMFTRNNHYNLSDHDPAIINIPGAFDD